MPDTTQRVAFLKKLHLFRGLTDDQLISVAREFEDVPAYTTSHTVFSQGAPGDAVYIIYSGKVTVNILDKVKGGTKTLATLIAGDYFGEESLVTRQKRSATIIAEPGTHLLKLDVAGYKNLETKFPQIKHNFNVVVRSRRLSRRLKFNWLQPNEIIYYLAGRHPITLIAWIYVPVLIFIGLFILGLLINGIYSRTWIISFFGFLMVLDLLVLIWQWIDWSNDYYIVTNERVMRTEKIIALYDSREEAPLGTIISVNVNSSGFIQRWIGLGDVVVRTFTTQITMYDVSYPNQVEAMVQEYWNRSKEKTSSVEDVAIKKALRLKLYPPPPKPIEEKPPEPKTKPESYATSLYRMFFANFLRVRFEDSNVVTYRKHWFVLVRDTFKQFVLFLFLIFVPIMLPGIFSVSLGASGWSILGLLLFGVIVWWIYDYVDWVNDVYKVTPDQIIDVYKKPLGKEQRKSAQLENIMSTSSERRGIVGLLLNYGIVKIKVGVEVFDFTDVFDPPQVEQDIIRRIAARKNKKSEAEKVAEAERMGTWLVNYHQISSETDDNERVTNS